MSEKKPKLLVILGPTATGKSSLAVTLAKHFNGEIISADSRQVYRGLNLGSGKITKKEMRGIPHHLLDVADPKKQFGVVLFKKLAEEKIKNIITRGKLPILCGGTGFYIDAVVRNITFPDVPANSKLRAKLNKKTAVKLFEILQRLDPKRAKNIDPFNKRRLVRAIEIAETFGKVPHIAEQPLYSPLIIGLTLPKEELQKRIYNRLMERLDKGMVSEAKKLHAARLSWKRMNELGLEYRYLALFLQKQISRNELISKLSTEIWRFAKRQMVWFKRDKNINWFTPSDTKKVEITVKKFLD